MEIRDMRMGIDCDVMDMIVAMRLRDYFFMLMGIMFIMTVSMFVAESLMLMRIILLKNKPNTEEHKGSGNNHLDGKVFSQDDKRCKCAYERCGAEVYAGS